jgi:hypothetical protein
MSKTFKLLNNLNDKNLEILKTFSWPTSYLQKKNEKKKKCKKTLKKWMWSFLLSLSIFHLPVSSNRETFISWNVKCWNAWSIFVKKYVNITAQHKSFFAKCQLPHIIILQTVTIHFKCILGDFLTLIITFALNVNMIFECWVHLFYNENCSRWCNQAFYGIFKNDIIDNENENCILKATEGWPWLSHGQSLALFFLICILFNTHGTLNISRI